MKLRTTLITIIALGMLAATGCKNKEDDPQADALAQQLGRLVNGGLSWGVVGGSVTKDGYDVTGQFSGFLLTIGADYTYETANSTGIAWPAAGTWQFNNSNPNELLRDDGVLIEIVSLSPDRLILKFTVEETSGGRIGGITGEFTFELTPG